MSEDEMSVFDHSADDDDGSPELQKQRASLQIYLDSVPYECETLEEMEEKLKQIVGKIMICAHAKNWLLLTTWDGMLQWCAVDLRPSVKQAPLIFLFSAGFLCVIPCPKRLVPSLLGCITNYALYPV